MRAGDFCAVYPNGTLVDSERKADGMKIERDLGGHDFSRRNDGGHEKGWRGERDVRDEPADFRVAYRDDEAGSERFSLPLTRSELAA